MKKRTTLNLVRLLTISCALSAIFCAPTHAQTVKRYALLEHFTNTRCGICASNNPTFFTAIDVEKNKNVHHVSYHSQIPYKDCAFYVLNKTEQDDRAVALYGIPGTPRVAVNGANTVSLSNVTAQLIADNAATSTVEVRVSESGTSPRTAKVTVKSVGTPPTGNHELYVAVVEKKVNYNAPNGEKTHYNVFRKFLKRVTTDVFMMPAKGAEISYSYGFDIESTWNGSEIYVLAFVQNVGNKQVVNSGTKFDATVSSLPIANIDERVSVSPNPCAGECFVAFENMTPQYLTLSDAAGRVILAEKNVSAGNYALKTNALARGIYFLKIQAQEGVAVKKVLIP